MTKRKQNQGLRLLVAQSSQKGCGWCVCFCLPSHLSSVFFCVVAPIHWETDLREAYASLRGVKGSLRGGVLFGVAYAGGYARIFCQQVWRSQLWGNFAYCPRSGFITFHFGLLWLHFLSFWPFAASFTFVGDLWLGLSVAYVRLTRRLRGAYAGGAGSFWQMYTNVLYSNSQLQGHQIVQQSQSLMFENIIYEKIRLRRFAYAMIYHPRIREVLTPLTQPCEFSGIALTRSFFSSLFFIALSF